MTRRNAFPVAFLRALVTIALLLVAPALAGAQFEPAPSPEPAPTEEAALISFVPRPEAVFLQRTAAHPDLGNTLVILVLPGEEVERLKAETDRYDLMAVGPDGQQVAFRDDGEEGDAAAGDSEYTAIADLDFDELAERAEEEGTNSERGENQVPVFEQRALVGETTVAPFDFDRFLGGARVQLSRSLSVSGGASNLHEDEEHEEEGGLNAIRAAFHTPGTNQFQDRVLMIINPLVVADPTRTFDPCTGNGTPMGPWTFGHLMTEMANQQASGIDPSTFAETWLNHWLADQPINGFTVPKRDIPMQAFIDDWRNASGGPGSPLDLSIAPFRLLAINPRIDLRTTVGGGGGYGATGSGAFLDAGEARFTFGVVLPQSYSNSRPLFVASTPIPNSNNCLAARFSVIFEYRVPKCKCKDVRDWARAWRRLNNFTPGSVNYNRWLERLTRTFTDRNRNPTRPNRSAIGQVRTNEISLDPFSFIWEIREFQLRMMPWSFLLETTTADTPDDSFGPPLNNSITFGNFVIDVHNGVAGPSVPLFYPPGSGNNFLGAHPQTPNPATTFWNAPNLVFPLHEDTRHLVSLGACNGCHAIETGLQQFQHIRSFVGALPTVLSGFLTGIQVNDPVTAKVRHFDDLLLRETDINAVARMACGRFRPVHLSPVLIGPLRSDGTPVRSIAAAATTDPDGPQLSLAPEDFLREVVQQVH